MVVNTDDLAFGYIRVSTEAQADEEKVSLETQADDIKEYSDAHGINPGRGYVRMALVADVATCAEGARRIAEFCR